MVRWASRRSFRIAAQGYVDSDGGDEHEERLPRGLGIDDGDQDSDDADGHDLEGEITQSER
jgi:hypothetical protein